MKSRSAPCIPLIVVPRGPERTRTQHQTREVMRILRPNSHRHGHTSERAGPYTVRLWLALKAGAGAPRDGRIWAVGPVHARLPTICRQTSRHRSEIGGTERRGGSASRYDTALSGRSGLAPGRPVKNQKSGALPLSYGPLLPRYCIWPSPLSANQKCQFLSRCRQISA